MATLRQARYRDHPQSVHAEPSPLAFARAAEGAGAHGITVHLREDRRHIQEFDVREIARGVALPLNLEMAATPEMLRYALRLKPANVCLVPEKREEVTTEGGLDVTSMPDGLADLIERLQHAGTVVSLFIDADDAQIDAAAKLGARVVELHTGRFAHGTTEKTRSGALKRLVRGAEQAHALGLTVNAGHGVNYENVVELFSVPHLNELNIGHAIISRALYTGAHTAVVEMLRFLRRYKSRP